MRRLQDLKKKDIAGKTCLLRVDFNVESSRDALRLTASLPTMMFLLKNGARLLILSHRGRPRLIRLSGGQVSGQAKGVERKFSLKPFVAFLQKNLKEQVIFLTKPPSALPDNGKVFLLENLRFWPGEETNSQDFARHLSKLGNFYVNDAFAVSHRANASITQLPKFLPSYAGLLLEKEIATLSRVMIKPKKPLVMIFGGSKIQDKLPVIKNLMPKATKILLGSSVLNQSNSLPKSSKICGPVDWLEENGDARDIGALTIKKYCSEIKKARTVIWNGPVGLFENKKYAGGSVALAKCLANSSAGKRGLAGLVVVGGGETTQLVLKLNLQNKIGFLSTGGGAMLEFLAGKKLPGIEALK